MSYIEIFSDSSGLSDIEREMVGHDWPLTSEEKYLVAQHRYDSLRDMFLDNNWTMRELLEYYNNLDVKPFIEAIENMTQYYIQRGVDIFKCAISG